jgi:uncharacterized iron-regulated membrane protein
MGCSCMHEDGPAEPPQRRPERTEHQVHSGGKVVFVTSDSATADKVVSALSDRHPDADVEVVTVPPTASSAPGRAEPGADQV